MAPPGVTAQVEEQAGRPTAPGAPPELGGHLDVTRENVVCAAGGRGTVTQARAEKHGGGWGVMWEAGIGDSILRRERWITEHARDIDAALLS